MRLGLIARADNSGLGIQTWEFYRHMKPAKTMVVDISKLNGNKQYPERYPDATLIYGFPSTNDVDTFLRDLDVVFIAESAYNPYLYTKARELGVKTAVQYNYEFFDWFTDGAPLPDLFIAPSMWHYAEVNAYVNEHNMRTGTNIGHKYLHCPVNRDILPFRQRLQARTFLHVAGRAAAYDRNGTETVIDCAQYLKTDAKIIIHFQGEQGLAHQATSSYYDYLKRALAQDTKKISMRKVEYENYQDVYAEGDVLLLPRRYGGNCLPMNEALSCGMPVIMSDVSPNNQFLLRNWLVAAKKTGQFQPRTVVDIYHVDPEELAEKIDRFYNMDENQMGFQNEAANEYADRISWGTMQPEYQKTLEALCQT